MEIRERARKAKVDEDAALAAAAQKAEFDDETAATDNEVVIEEEDDSSSVISHVGWKRSLPSKKKYFLACEIDFDKEVEITRKKIVGLATMAIDSTKSKQPVSRDVYSLREETSNVVDKIYNENFDSLVKPDDIDFLDWTEHYVRDKVFVLHLRAKQVEKAYLVESALRFHRLIHRAFQNLLSFTVIKRNSRNSQEYYKLKSMKKIFDALYNWATRYII